MELFLLWAERAIRDPQRCSIFGVELRGFRGELESSVDVFALQKPRGTAGQGAPRKGGAGRTAKSGSP